MICTLSRKDGKPNWCNHHEMFHPDHYAIYAVDPGPKGEKFRALWDRQKAGIHTDRPLPSIARRTVNYLSSLSEHIAGGGVLVDEAMAAHRKKRCQGCQYRNREHDACSLCGCPLHETVLGDKMKWATARCFNWERHGVAIGCYNLPKLAELQILVINDKCGAMPILLCDDTKPGTERQKQHAELAKKYLNVQYWPNPENYGHHRGDATVFWKAIQWAHVNDMQTVCKLSMRHIINIDKWLQSAHEGLLASGEATGCVNCIDNDTRLFIRSECVMLNVRKWFDTGAWKELTGRNSYAPAVELHYNHLMCKYFGVQQATDEKGVVEYGRRWNWPLLSERRNQYTEGIIWHCANLESDYHDLAKKYGIELDADFHTDGSQKRVGFSKGYRIG